MATPASLNSRVAVQLRLSRFDLPPVESALIVGRSAPIGSRAMLKALEEMLPDTYVRIGVEHERIEAVIVRKAHLRRLPEGTLVAFLVGKTEDLIDESEMLRVSMSIEITTSDEFEL